MDRGERALAEAVAARVGGHGAAPLLVGLAGGVAVGKSTLAATLSRLLASRGLSVVVLCTDAFLFRNDVLAERGLTMRKGFPETFDRAAIVECLRTLRSGRPCAVPVYSHATYDIVAGDSVVVEPRAVVLVEGVNVLQEPVGAELDLAIYLDAHDDDVRAWFVERFLALCDGAGRGSFYRAFATLGRPERLAIATAAWESVNLVNLRDHIGPSRSRADLVARKSRDHTLVRVMARDGTAVGGITAPGAASPRSGRPARTGRPPRRSRRAG